MEKGKTASGGIKKLSLSASIRKRQQEGWFPVISEIKVRSDKEGDLLGRRDPVELAREMVRCPVAGISVVTEPEHFGGSMGLLRSVAAAVGLPVLHKDFITSERRIEESAAFGASAILLIAAMLGTEQLARLIEAAKNCGLETLVEAHTLTEVRRIEDLGFDLMGINNRDITVYETDDDDVARTEDLARFCGQGRPLISESSINTAEEVRRAGRSGADAVLIGTAVLKAEPMSELLGELVSVGWPP
ncbi:indole-3-glycerol-phosphate synthase [Syntrophorhabdus aromaticivorans]|uniref:indole-3-glycerol-phosphate synthase n=1 Tax=Syntrophorhabdus aromaticivorans TaxID=328301 RepID=UPI000A02C440|nr:indole-3-glycerol-phosphate synthase [Syntrophorhabdus aromaticivorans]